MLPELEKLLDHLADSLDGERRDEVDELHRRALRWEPVERLPLVLAYPLPADAPFAPFPHREVFDDPEKMLFNQLVSAFDTHVAYSDAVGDDLPWTLRANYGTVLIASLFGARVEQVDDNPPWALPFESLDAFRACLDRDPTDFTQGWLPRVIKRYAFYAETLAGYSELARRTRVVLPDLQGPLDTVELLRGSEVYTDFYTDPDLMTRALSRVAEAQVAFAKHLAPLLTDGPEGFSHQHAFTIPGRILIRDDSAINLSPTMYRDAVAPHDEYVLREMGGGGIHACGAFGHNVPEALALPSLRCLDFGQPEMNDMDVVYALARERRVPLVRARVPEEELTTGRVMERFPTGVTLLHGADSPDHAGRVMAAYRAATA